LTTSASMDAAMPVDASTVRRRIVVATSDVLGARMAGPAIRATRVAAALSAEHDVELVTLTSSGYEDPRYRTTATDAAGLAARARVAEVVVVQGDVFDRCPQLSRTPAVVVCDMYDPIHLEQLEQARDLGERRRRDVVRRCSVMINAQLLRGDFFLCASDKQRDFWLGQLAALGRVNPVSYDDDQTLRRLIDVAPFGTPGDPPVRTGPGARGVIPGIEPGDELLLWGGGVYNWFDPLTLVEAVHRLRQRRPRLRLLFLGMKHPNADVPEMAMAYRTRRRSDELGLTGSAVFFNEQWVAYDRRQDYLLEADIGVSTHLDHVETAFSFRTRVLDYLWAGLPVLTTAGDTLADLVEERGLGLTVSAQDVDALAAAIDGLLGDQALWARCRQAVEVLQPELTWEVALRPLLAFCRGPHRAPDLLDGPSTAGVRAPLRHPRAGVGWVAGDLRLVREHLGEGGPALLAARVLSRLRHRLAGRR